MLPAAFTTATATDLMARFTGSLTLDRTLSALCCSMTLRGLGSSEVLSQTVPLFPPGIVLVEVDIFLFVLSLFED